MSSFAVRNLNASDSEAIERLWVKCQMLRPEERADAEIRLLLELPSALILGIDGEDGSLVGSVCGQFDGRRGWMGRLAVDPDVRRGGMGRALVEELERQLVEAGAPRIELNVFETNEAARSLYASMGYREWTGLIVASKWFTPNGRH